MSLPVLRLPRGALVALFVVACATVPVALLTDGWNGAGPRDSVVLEQAKGRLLLRTYGETVAAALVPCPSACVYFAVFCLLLTPVATLVVTASRRARGGSALHDLGVHVAHTIAVLAASYVAMGLWFAFKSGVAAPLDWMPRLFLVNAVYALPFVSLAAALAALSPSAVIAMSAHCVVLGLFLAAHVIGHVAGSPIAEQLPSSVDGLLLSGTRAEVLRGVGVALSWSVLFGVVAVLGSISSTEEKDR